MRLIQVDLKDTVEAKADEISRYIFNYYFSQLPYRHGINKRLLSKSRLVDSSPAVLTHEPAIFGEAIHKLVPRKIQIVSNFRPDDSVNMTFGLAAKGLRLLHCELPKAKNELRQIVTGISDRAYRNQGKAYWPHYVKMEHGDHLPFINLGLPKGIGGVIAFLSLCYVNGIEKSVCLDLIQGAIKTILWVDQKTKRKELPAGWGYLPYEKKHPMSWMYGDLTIGYVLTLAGFRCERSDWLKAGQRIFSRGLSTEKLKERITTCNFMFGGAGISHLALRYSQLTGSKEALFASKVWLSATNERFLNVAKAKEPSEFRKNPQITPSLLNSSLGVYLVNWHHEGFIDAKWDSILGLSNPISGEII